MSFSIQQESKTETSDIKNNKTTCICYLCNIIGCILYFPFMFLFGPIVWFFYVLKGKKFNSKEKGVIVMNIFITASTWLIIISMINELKLKNK